jgi:hypothetical protein
LIDQVLCGTVVNDFPRPRRYFCVCDYATMLLNCLWVLLITELNGS